MGDFMLKKILISSALAATSIAPTFAQEAAPAPEGRTVAIQLTEPEAQAMSIYTAWQACIKGKENGIFEQAKTIAAARAKAGNAATAKAAKDTKLVTAEDVTKLNELLEQSEAQFLGKVLAKAVKPDVACKTEMKIDQATSDTVDTTLRGVELRYPGLLAHIKAQIQ
jgi:hypothetical protein